MVIFKLVVVHEIVVLNGEAGVFFLESVDVLTRSGDNTGDAELFAHEIAIFNGIPYLLVVLESIREGEVISENEHHVLVIALTVNLINSLVEQHSHLFMNVVVRQGWVVLDTLVMISSLIIIEANWVLIVLLLAENSTKDLLLGSEMLVHWSPHEKSFMVCWVESLSHLIDAGTGKEESLKAQIVIDGSVGLGMAKWINVPSNGW